MSRAILALMVLVIATTACGIKRPLVRPKDIPAYEAKRARKMQKFETKPEEQPATTTEPLGNPSLQQTMTPMPPVEQ